MKGIEVTKISIELSQEGNTLDTTSEYESLTVNLEYQLTGPGEYGFLVVKTDGWSVDDPSEFSSLLEKIVDTEKFLKDRVEYKEE